MSRWNISQIIYYSQHNKNRVLEITPNDVTIITGASKTGKTYIIETIDYCLCSSSINLSNFIKKKISCVAIKFIKDNTEILVAREISQTSLRSNNMYIEIGNKVIIPTTVNELKGSIKEEQARKLLAERFGIINFNDYDIDETANINNISIRQLAPYLYLDKGVIDSSKIILHGLDDANASKHIIPSLPYFLNAVSIDELKALKKLKGLKKGIENEEKKALIYQKTKEESISKSNTLFNEAIQVGLLKNEDKETEVTLIIDKLKQLQNWQPDKIVFENEKRLNEFQNLKGNYLTELNLLKHKKNAAYKNRSIHSDFTSITEQQKSKLNVDELFRFDNGNCPICETHLTKSSKVSELIKESFQSLRKENQVVAEYKPKMEGYITELELSISNKKLDINKVETQIQNLIKESDVAKKQKDNNNMKLRTLGRISYYIDNQKEIEKFNSKKLTEYCKEFNEINKKYGKIQRKEKIEEAERLISNIATKNLSFLPIDETYKDDNINFISKKPTIELSNNETGDIEKFPSIGSDENYLSIHLAFMFALHKFFEIKKSPVLGLIVIDQVSRPYYPKDLINQDIIDEDREALEKHFNFIFNQVANQKGLQVIILEHAYFHKNEKYKKATKYKWPRDGEERLIPKDWPDFE
ncbi:DUF3732 domain-containing protein [Tenacibaculum finnmarkense]|uniref:DUF3732 domain-containing protein n=1 Tax=Tenacibaculum finnmarkense TaxID=2781243 RepID=UPI001EFB50D9|nr:DUF3732 domain-containing protein [Tenacibaculum finnmarkense]MCG8807335.1 DUF3732 domain-containing protein [Tenacibaculum finnmarkense]MCG8817576.1 DUF3732 domain-containing protein [Tenacibaculum finnmarkense]MCG8857824.1 DUF3732 domain-containing protein [Tenacibaculum finnmarkense]